MNAMGKLVTDTRRGLQFSYNLANLPSKVEGLAQGANAGLTLNYRYLSDGTKVSATLSDGDTTEGLRYRGSFVYLVKDGKEVLSSIPWSDGRIEYVYDFPVPVEGDGLGEEELVSDEPQLLEIVDCWHVTDHLGSTRAVVALNQGGVVLEQNSYLPFGTRYDVSAPLAYGTGDNRYRFAGKEEQRFGQDPVSGASRIDLGLLDFGARLYDPCTARWTTRDPLAGKYLPVSPYGYCAGDPVNLIDARGEDIYLFSENGEYQRKIDWEGEHCIAVSSVDRKGNTTFKFYGFADAINDPKRIDEGEVNRIEFVSENTVKDILSQGGAFDAGLGIFDFITSSNSLSTNDYPNFDYSSGVLPNYYNVRADSSKDGDPYTSSSLYLVEGDKYVHNLMNFGNYLWSASGFTFGLPLNILKLGAHLNSLGVFDPRNNTYNGYHPQLDSSDDQLSISEGYRHAKRNKYKKNKQ